MTRDGTRTYALKQAKTYIDFEVAAILYRRTGIRPLLSQSYVLKQAR